MDFINQNDSSEGTVELNPPAVRNVKLMGILSLSDWILFFAGVFVVVCIFIFDGGLNSNSIGTLAIKLLICIVILGPWAIFCFLQDKSKGKLRKRLYRFVRSSFQKKVFSSAEIKEFFCITDIAHNHIHYRSGLEKNIHQFID
jgi:hypothetical protein